MKQSNDIKVWDIGIRLFHWLLLATFSVAYISREMHDLHTWSGYTLIALLGFRIIWGFSGSRHARFSDFIYSPKEVLRYLRGIARRDPPYYIGHNPAGGWMIVLMLLTLVMISFTGLKALADEGEGPFASWQFNLLSIAHAHGDEKHTRELSPEDKPVSEPPVTNPMSSPSTGNATASENEHPIEWGDYHAALVDFMLFLIAIHLIGVIVSSYLHSENLVRAMITGAKRKHD